MQHWQQARTALYVLRLGTVSAAAAALEVHRATVIRHIDELEQALNSTLFQRHGRGYTSTEAGIKFRQAVETTKQRFSQLAQELDQQQQQLGGNFVVTSLPGLDQLIVPALVDLQQQHPLLEVQLHASKRVFQMEFGEAHVAIRAGTKPQDPDNIVIPFACLDAALYAHPNYLATYGTPQTLEDLQEHRFIGLSRTFLQVPFMAWLQEQQLLDRISFQVSSIDSMTSALQAGAGLAFISPLQAQQYPGLVQVMPSQPEWQSSTWIVTHKDLHRSTKVQTFLEILNQHQPFRAA